MRALLNQARYRWLFLAGIVFIAGTIILVAGKNWLADTWARSAQAEDWLRAAELEPRNAEHWYRLGRYRQLDFERADLPLAISYYRRAVALDPRSALYWMDLATAYEMAGDPVRAREAFEAAKAAHPASSEVAWRYGNFLLRQERLPEGFAEIRRGVATDAKLAGAAASRCLRAGGNIEQVLHQALPVRQDVYLGALEALVVDREVDAALAVWNRLVALPQVLELGQAFRLLETLIEQDRIADAQHVWEQALRVAGRSPTAPADRSLVWDGGFEADFLDMGFGWRHTPVPGATLEFDNATSRSGSRSLRVTFDGTANLDFAHLVQYVPVEPNTRYRFTAHVRTEGITTNSGVQVWLFDRRRPERLAGSSSNFVGTHPWTKEEVEFTTGPQTRLIEIILRRLPSQKFDNKIRGMVWVDDVSLVPVPPETLQ